jgi:hypothetical protein
MRAPDVLAIDDFEIFALKIAVYAVLNLDAVPSGLEFMHD